MKAIGQGAQILAAANLTVRTARSTSPRSPAAACVSNSMFIADQTLTLDDPKGLIAPPCRSSSATTAPRSRASVGALDSGRVGQARNRARRHRQRRRTSQDRRGRPLDARKLRAAHFDRRRGARRRDERAQFPAPLQGLIGLTPSEYLLRARLDASCMLLTATDLPVDKIARRCARQRRRTREDLSQAAVDLADRIPDRGPPQAERRMTRPRAPSARVP